jgi:predicted enzyme related to lactoylglutathione lyase
VIPYAERKGELVSDTTITGIRFGACYVDDWAAARAFYEEVLGLTVGFEAMPDQVLFYEFGEDPFGIMLCKVAEGAPGKVGVGTAHSAFVLSVASAGALFAKLTGQGVTIPQDEPIPMGEGDFWFQFEDPAGNLLEVLGGE